MRVLFVTDSLGAPRPAVPWEFTFPALLRRRFAGREDIFFCRESRRGSTTACLRDPELLPSYLPDVVIVQLGIVDCVPRIFTKLESALLARLPERIRNILIRLGKHVRKRSERRAYVKPDACRRNWQAFLDQADEMDCRVLVIPVALPGKVFSADNPGAEKSIRQYNESVGCLAAGSPRAAVLPSWDREEESYDDLFLPDDGYHLSKRGHERMAGALYPILEEELREKDRSQSKL
ncbi:MAG: SGNH/GDSL hydrolase family protein [Lentisphaeria bacterium]|nr:SGNH/GDSL hydrolase family protein [Lentisphaeria bacterium]